MSTPNRPRSLGWKRPVAAVATLITILASVIAILDYRDKHSRYDLSGTWIIENTVEHSSYEPFRGGQITLELPSLKAGPILPALVRNGPNLGGRSAGEPTHR
jgi:hypothetical protein